MALAIAACMIGGATSLDNNPAFVHTSLPVEMRAYTHSSSLDPIRGHSGRASRAVATFQSMGGLGAFQSRRRVILRLPGYRMQQQGLSMQRSEDQTEGWAGGENVEYSFTDGSDEESSSDQRDVVAGIDKQGRDVSDQMVVGAGALRGEQELYSMRDLQGMKVPRLRSMCEARGLKKIGTKPELINRLLASTIDAEESVQQQQQALSQSPTPSRLKPTMDGIGPSTLMSSGSSPIPAHAAGRNLRNAEVEEYSEEEELGDATSSASVDPEEQQTPATARPATRSPASHPAMVNSEQIDPNPDFRPSGKDLERIINAPKIVRRAGRAVTLASSKVNRYQPDRKKKGSTFSALKKPTDADVISPLAAGPSDEPSASTLNGIPREFLPPSLRAFDPSFQNRRRGPGRPRQDGGESDDENQSSEWDMVRAGGGMQSNPTASPFEAMIAADEERERLEAEASGKGRRRKKKAAVIELLEEEEEEDEDYVYVAPAVKKIPAALVTDDDDDEDEVVEDIDDDLPDLEEDQDEANIPLVFEDGTTAEADDDEDDDDKLNALFKGEGDAEEEEGDEDSPPPKAPPAKRGRGRPPRKTA